VAKLLCINSETYRPGVNEIGDVVVVMPDEHQFSPAEEAGFDIVSIPGTVADYAAEQKKKMAALKPKDMTEEEEMVWESSTKYRMKVVDKKALSIADATACKMPTTKPILAAER